MFLIVLKTQMPVVVPMRRKEKPVALLRCLGIDGFGAVRIEREADMPGAGFMVSVTTDVGELPAWFAVRHGRVEIVQTCDGLRAVRGDLRDALQGALRVAA